MGVNLIKKILLIGPLFLNGCGEKVDDSVLKGIADVKHC